MTNEWINNSRRNAAVADVFLAVHRFPSLDEERMHNNKEYKRLAVVSRNIREIAVFRGEHVEATKIATTLSYLRLVIDD